MARLRQFARGCALSLAFLPAVLTLPVNAAQISGKSMSLYTAGPITTVSQVTPLVMLAMSRDHQYFYKAYNDTSDLDGDGTTETTYKDGFEYYGYFNSRLCYVYSDANARFEPAGATDAGANKHYCLGGMAGNFSGNFLNWATMTRMDIVRKILYGGLRSTDTSTLTVLERAHLPTDAHSFTKYYNGADLAKLTPYSTVKVDATTGNKDGYDNADEGVTICNTTYDSGGTMSQTTLKPPLMRVVAGNYQLWAANERWQCTWQGEHGSNPNSNNKTFSGIDASANDPPDSARLKTAGGNYDLTVRVKVCDPTYYDGSSNLENCELYPSGNRKPTGLLQRYGEKGLIKFGLVTGSWTKNISGGALRKALSDISDEVNLATDGTFKAEPTTTGGIIGALNMWRMYGYQYGTGDSGSGNGTYFPASGSTPDNCPFQLTSLTEGQCKSWGNPISEIYLETLRYFATSGTRAPLSQFDPNDAAIFPNPPAPPPGMIDVGWTPDPLSISNACAKLNIIVFNASINSYDSDQTNLATGLFPGTTVAAETDKVGDKEGITGNNYFIGNTASVTDNICTAKTITKLSEAKGMCPEGPTLGGTYHMVGMAYYAHTHDMRSDLTSSQDIRTFGVQLATSVPRIAIPIGPDTPGQKSITLLPAYRLLLTPPGAGTIVDFKIIRKHTEVDPGDVTNPGTGGPVNPPVADGKNDIDLSGTPTTNTKYGLPSVNFPVAKSGTGIFHGKFYVNWEDSQQGGDYDQDVWGTIDYVVNTKVSPATVSITTDTVAESTVNGQLFGFVLSGTTKDGFHAYSGVESANYTDPTGVKGCTTCIAESQSVTGGQKGKTTYTFTVSDKPAANLLENPLYYAAKWGGFTDSDGDGTPNLRKEWDVRDQHGQVTPDKDGDGQPDGDGIPDNYFFVSNPAALEDALTSVFDIIIERVSSGTAAAVVANDQEGTGAVFQALYDPLKSDNTLAQNKAEWIGTLHALWVDKEGFIREDNNQNGALDGYDVDLVVNIFFDPVDRRSKIKRYKSTDPLVFKPDTTPPDALELTALKPIWNARRMLADLDAGTVNTQRPYTTAFGNTSGSGRHILTWVDDDLNGLVKSDGSETVSFDATTMTSGNRYRWLDQDDPTLAAKLVNWVRGVEIPGYRNRTVDYDGDNVSGVATTPSGQPEVMRLGDIIQSTPVPVAAPVEAYDLLSLDDSYLDFRLKYAERRQVVYIGGNDGMIHAFNAGFFDSVNRKFLLSPHGETAHPLGAEIWAYIPKNLLPQLQWLARPDYAHVFYMDQTPRLFDAKIFATDSTHPNGWGTVLVAGMRFGGGTDANKIGIDINKDSTVTAAETTKSAYVVLDVTDPEKPPVVLAELSPPSLNLTTSFPQVVTVATPAVPGTKTPKDATSPNAWYLVFGSGPTDLSTGTSSQSARLFAYDLTMLAKNASSLSSIDGARVTSGVFADSDGAGNSGFANTNQANSFVGDPLVADTNINMRAETLYFGTVGGTTADSGALWRLGIDEKSDASSWGPLLNLLPANKPFISQPSVTIDEKFRTWVIAGTGRLMVNGDKTSSAQQSLYGFIDPNPDPSTKTEVTQVNPLKLFDVSKTVVMDNNQVDEKGDKSIIDATFSAFQDKVLATNGWVRNYYANTSSTPPAPSERSVNRSTLIDGVLFNTAFTPSVDLCSQEGTSRLFALAYNTGTALPTPVLGLEACPACPDQDKPDAPKKSKDFIDLGAGLASTPSIHLGEQEIPGKITVITQKSTGAIDTTSAQTQGGVANGEISWREYRNY